MQGLTNLNVLRVLNISEFLGPVSINFSSSATVPAILFGDSTTGIYKSGTNELSVANAGVQTAKFTSANNFAVGMNTTPTDGLSVMTIGDTTTDLGANRPLLVLSRSISDGQANGNPDLEIINFNTGSARLYIQTGNAASNARAFLFGNFGSNASGNWWVGGPAIANSLFIQEDRNGSYSQTPAIVMFYMASDDIYFRSTASSAWHFYQTTTEIFSIGSASVDSKIQFKGKGTATNDSAAAGYIGEYVESLVSATSNAATSTQFKDYASISLTSGDWDVDGILGMQGNGATYTQINAAISVNSGNTTTDHVIGSNEVLYARTFGTTDFDHAIIPGYRLSLSGTTTVYLKGAFTYSAGTPRMNTARLSARRRR